MLRAISCAVPVCDAYATITSLSCDGAVALAGGTPADFTLALRWDLQHEAAYEHGLDSNISDDCKP